MALVWPSDRAAVRARGESLLRLLRAGFHPSHAEIVNRFQTANKRTSVHPLTSQTLPISHRLVKLMAGKIDFCDTPGGGATFWFRIPATHGLAP